MVGEEAERRGCSARLDALGRAPPLVGFGVNQCTGNQSTCKRGGSGESGISASST